MGRRKSHSAALCLTGVTAAPVARSASVRAAIAGITSRRPRGRGAFAMVTALAMVTVSDEENGAFESMHQRTARRSVSSCRADL